MKKALINTCAILLCGIVVFANNHYFSDNEVIQSKSNSSVESKSDLLTLMYETGDGTGEYQASTDTTWPSGYIFNSTLSACENGSSLSWDDENKKVIVSSNRSDKCYVYFDKIPTFADHIKDLFTTQGTNGLYLHNSSLTNSANDGSYRYAGGDYQLTSKATSASYSTLIDSSDSATTGLIKFYCNGTKRYVGYQCTATQAHYYTVAGSGSYSTYNEALDAGVSQGYLTKDNVKNFVCFGSTAATCPTANLYRIIGLIDGKIKLIKYDYANTTLLGTDGDYSTTNTSSYYSAMRGETPASHYWYYWNVHGTNTWSESQLNTVNLNTNYIKNIGSTWASKIASTTWKVGGNTYSNIYNVPVATTYKNEITSPAKSTTYTAKIGLMYVSEYGYATDPSNWTTNLSSYNSAAAKSTNWMYMGDYDWTISRLSDSTISAFFVYNFGAVNYNYVHDDYYGVRPSFNLESSVSITGGSGTASDPYRLG